MWFVYILRCADGTLYTGITEEKTNDSQDDHGPADWSKYGEAASHRTHTLRLIGSSFRSRNGVSAFTHGSRFGSFANGKRWMV